MDGLVFILAIAAVLAFVAYKKSPEFKDWVDAWVATIRRK